MKFLKKIKLGLPLLIMVVLFYNCQREGNLIESHSHKIINKVSLSDFKNRVIDKDYGEISKYFESNILSKKSSRTESSMNFIILTENIIMTLKNENTFFTFQIRPDTIIGNEFYNLILTVNGQQQIVKSEVYEYVPYN